MLGLETAFDVRAAHGRANLILNQDGKNQVSAETLDLFQVGNQEIKFPWPGIDPASQNTDAHWHRAPDGMPAVLNFDSFPLWKSKRRGNAAVSSRAGAEIKNAAPMIYINDFFCDDHQAFPGFFAGKNQNNQNNSTRRRHLEISRNRLEEREKRSRKQAVGDPG
jgi:hypothetical protein